MTRMKHLFSTLHMPSRLHGSVINGFLLVIWRDVSQFTKVFTHPLVCLFLRKLLHMHVPLLVYSLVFFLLNLLGDTG